MCEGFTVNSSRVSFFPSHVFKSLALSPLFSLSPLVLLFLPGGAGVKGWGPWKNIRFPYACHEGIHWLTSLHLGAQWQMGLQFSAWLRGNKAHFHFPWWQWEYSLPLWCSSRPPYFGCSHGPNRQLRSVWSIIIFILFLFSQQLPHKQWWHTHNSV